MFGILLLAALGPPTFYRDILPVLQSRCQQCHRPGEVAPMPLLTYKQVRPWAKSIRESVVLKRMPPWFAEPGFGPFSNDRSLSNREIETLKTWVDAGSQEGDPRDAPPSPRWTKQAADQVFGMPQPFPIPAKGDIDYQYVVIPTGFTEDKWVQTAELIPGNRSVIHHAVVYIREPGSAWLHDAKPGVPYVPPGNTPRERLSNGWTTSDILLVYSPGSSPENWGKSMGKLIKAGSDLVLQFHYTPNGHATSDQSKVGLVFHQDAPKQRVLTLQLNNDGFIIPSGHPHYRVSAWGTMPNDTELISFFPHMHLRGASFEYNIVEPDGKTKTLLRVNPYNFYWQLSYRLANPFPVKAGAKLECVAYFDNSRNNPNNPDPEEAVRFGPQSYEEMMIGFFDIAVDRETDKNKFFIRDR